MYFFSPPLFQEQSVYLKMCVYSLHVDVTETSTKFNCSLSEYLSGTYITRDWNMRQTKSLSLCSPHLAGGDREQARKFQPVITAGNEI